MRRHIQLLARDKTDSLFEMGRDMIAQLNWTQLLAKGGPRCRLQLIGGHSFTPGWQS